jgi:hypothetical protein
VLLDLAADRYFCLPAGFEAAFVRVAEGRPAAGDRPTLKLLLERGLLLEARHERARLPQGRQIPTPMADLFPDKGGKARAADGMRALAFEAWSSWRLRTRGLLSVARETERRENSLRVPASDATGRLGRIVSGLASLRLFIREADRCLIRGLAVHAACCRAGIPAHLVLGVQLHPFQAHAWVQLGDKIVVGDFEQVRLFTPIAVLG